VGDIIKMDLRCGVVWNELFWLRIEVSGELFVNTVINFHVA
jgi:hypothetical protein